MYSCEAPGCCGVHIIKDFAGDDYRPSASIVESDIKTLGNEVVKNDKSVSIQQVNITDYQKEFFHEALLELGFAICASGINSKTGNIIHTYLRTKPTVVKKISKLLNWEKK